jgi:hypothetical protein
MDGGISMHGWYQSESERRGWEEVEARRLKRDRGPDHGTHQSTDRQSTMPPEDASDRNPRQGKVIDENEWVGYLWALLGAVLFAVGYFVLMTVPR